MTSEQSERWASMTPLARSCAIWMLKYPGGTWTILIRDMKKPRLEVEAAVGMVHDNSFSPYSSNNHPALDQKTCDELRAMDLFEEDYADE